MVTCTLRVAGVAAAALAACVSISAAASASSLWCPEAVLAEGLDPVLQRIITEAPFAYGDSGVPENTPPPWLDRKRLATGQKFTQTYTIGIALAHIHALFMVLVVPSVLDVLVYTGNSDTPDEAWSRYYDTIVGVSSWYATDIYEPGTWGYEQMKRVRGLHRMVRRDMNEREDQDAVRNRTRLDGDFSGCPAAAAMRRDLDKVVSSACPFAGQRRAPPAATNTIDDADQDRDESERRSTWMSQYDMAITQWAFISPVILFPEKYGMSNATDELLDGFVHLWETLGYSLGIEDKFNMCQGGLAATRRRARQAMAAEVLPHLRRARQPWEYMARCMADGLAYFIPGADFNTQLELMLQDTLGASVPSVNKLLSPAQHESAKGLREILTSLKRDRQHRYWGPISVASKYLLNTRMSAIPRDGIKRLRHRNPHRSKNCYAEIRP